ncbi:uncharacterized protein LOC128964552 [Oppia nitens]|uniref:uncharacterized protein LOC128964552 n=1 Tax=Oppia nitens TaxID=1686743 RepID=UPI0023DA576A|nr:uncharacterized protein LOC128964552 [Oppia nitens]
MFYLLFSLLFFIFVLTPTGAQYSSQSYCDHNRLQRCQRDITQNVQDISNAQSGSGYSGQSSGYQSSNNDIHLKCSEIRRNLDCLLRDTAPCITNTTHQSYGTSGSSYVNNMNTDRNSAGDFIRRAKQTLERYCEQGGGGWRTAACFMRQEVRDCENRYGFQSNPPPVSTSSCRNFEDLRDCVRRYVSQSCSQDLQLMATYLIDKGQDLSWSCVAGQQDYDSNRRYDTNNDHNRYDQGRNGYDNNRDRYGGSSSYGNQYDRDRYGGSSSYGNQYDRDRYGGSAGSNQYDRDRIDRERYDRDRLGGGSSGSIDRFGGGYYPTTDSCLERSQYFVRSCEDTLVQRQRDAREGRSSTDVGRRICCALFFYRDCISRVVVDRCRDPSPTVVDVLMGSRKSDLTVRCREYSRDQCSHSQTIKSSFIAIIITTIFIAFKAIKSNQF